MADRAGVIEQFLADNGWAGAERRVLAGDASFRRYDRLSKGARRAVLMDAPPPEEDVRPFVAVARHLAGLGYSAPEIYAEDHDAGLLLMEDLGDDTYTRVLAGAGGAGESDLYALAVDVLIDLHGRPAAEVLPAAMPSYDEQRLLDEALLLTDWYLPLVTGEPVPAEAREGYAAVWRAVLAPVIAGETTLVLRDFHVDNLISLPARPGVAACGLLDFQDAVAGHPAYDLMSLLEDARRDIAPELQADMRARYRAAFPGLSAPGSALESFDAAYAILGAQRHAKVIGIFTRLSRRDAKDDYLVHIPRVWRLLERSMNHAHLAPIRDWFDRHVPQSLRRQPEARA